MTKDEALAVQELVASRGGKVFLSRLKADWDRACDRLLDAPPAEWPVIIGEMRVIKRELKLFADAGRVKPE